MKRILCTQCDELVRIGRARLGYRTCLDCGESAAIQARSSWCIAPVAHKQGATLVTNKADLKGLNKYQT